MSPIKEPMASQFMLQVIIYIITCFWKSSNFHTKQLTRAIGCDDDDVKFNSNEN